MLLTVNSFEMLPKLNEYGFISESGLIWIDVFLLC